MDTLVLSSVLILSLCTISTLSLALSVFSPADNHIITAGPTAAAFHNRNFLPDDRSSNLNSPLLSSNTRSISLLPNPNPDPAFQIHRSARIFTKPTKYAFQIAENGTHIVRLHFYPFVSPGTDLYGAVFHVIVNGYVVLTNFSASGPVIKEYFVPVDDNDLVIRFVPSEKGKLGFVNAIEVISAPRDLIPDTVGEFYGLTKQALETVYRVNVGGRKVTPFNDTLWRTWVPDDGFFVSGDVAERVHFGGRVYYQKGGASREVAPDFVYNTARVISSRNASVPDVNMTWVFPVPDGYKYLVRLHFCDIASMALYFINFNVYVNGDLAAERVDLSSIWNSLAAPIYKDFVVDGSSSGVLKVSVGPSNESQSFSIDGILNGVEIMKMNNSMGSLAGEACVGMVLKNWRGREVGILVPFLAVVCLMLSLSALLHRRTVGTNGTSVWTRLPTNSPESSFKQSDPQLTSKATPLKCLSDGRLWHGSMKLAFDTNAVMTTHLSSPRIGSTAMSMSTSLGGVYEMPL